MKNIYIFTAILFISIGCGSKNSNTTKATLPKYQIVLATDIYTGKGKAGEIIIPTISRDLKASEREKILRDILHSEGWLTVSAFSTKEAHKEKSCAEFNKRSTAFKLGYIGKIDENGQFLD